MWPFESWGEDRVTIPLAQQGKQPICEFEEGIQGHILAGGDHSILPVSCSPQRLHDCAELLPGALKDGQGKAWPCWSLLSEAWGCHGYLDWSLGWAQPTSTSNSNSSAHRCEQGWALFQIKVDGLFLVPFRCSCFLFITISLSYSFGPMFSAWIRVLSNLLI